MSLKTPKNPCSTCPYRKDTPFGLWHHEEYEKLRTYDEGQDEINPHLFLCHQTNITNEPTVCKGWVMVHDNSIAVRLALATGNLKYPECFETPDVELYASGNEAADAGQRDIDNPSEKSQKLADKLLKTGNFKAK